MKKAYLALLLWLTACGGIYAGEISWEEIGKGIGEARAVLVSADNPRLVIAGTNRCLWRSEDAGENFSQALVLRGGEKQVNFLYFGSFASGGDSRLYASGAAGLFESRDKGKSWQRIFRCRRGAEGECTSVAIYQGKIFLGTRGGLFFSGDYGRTWNRETGKLGKEEVISLSASPGVPGTLYAVSSSGVFALRASDKSWERIFVDYAAGKIEAREEASDGSRENEERAAAVRYVCSAADNPQIAYLATDRGVYKSADSGKSWQRLPEYGLLNSGANFILAEAGGSLIASTGRGIFLFQGGRWEELSFRLPAQRISFLAKDRRGRLYAATEKGLFRAQIEGAVTVSQAQSGIFCPADGPGIREVQQAAIKYAEVEPRKIINWRRQAACRAALPRVSASVGRNTSDLWHWESGSSTKANDDVLIRGRDSIDWDLTLSWDLADLVWSEAQASIDVRSRLMVQLRDDILDEVTKLYFERLRVKLELDQVSIEERQKRMEKELRLRELTASIDALTGGFFSRQLSPGP
jgi:photosystem II stability/assembly factor-like uncharacterized protein